MPGNASPPLLPPLRTPHPWRIGLPSFLLPAGYVENVRYAAGVAEDVEILLFEPDRGENWPSARDVEELADLARRHGHSYTVHLPCERDIASPDAAERRAAREDCRHAIERTRPLRPYAYILHLGSPGAPGRAPERAELSPLLARIEDSRRLCLETMGADPEALSMLAERERLSLCLDTGHLAGAGIEAAGAIRNALPQVRVVHLHARDEGGKDHQPLAQMPQNDLQALLRALNGFDGVLTLEVFGADAAASSLGTLDAALREANS